MRKIAIGVAALTMATAVSTLTAPAVPGAGSPGVAQSVGHGDGNTVDKVAYRRRGAYGFRHPVMGRRVYVPAYGFRHPVLGRRVAVRRHGW